MMIEFDEYKVKLNGLKPKLDELAASLGIERCKEDIERLHAQIESPGFWDNAEVSQKVMKQARQVEAKVERYEKMCSHWEDLMTICEMAIEENDDSMLEELKEGYTALEEEMERERLETLLSGEYDGNNAIVSFQAGAGGTEAQDWAEMLYRMYTRFAERRKFKVKVLDYLDGDEAGIKSVSMLISGENAYGYLKSESGVHRLVRVSPFDASGRRHTSFASVEVLPEFNDETDIEINEADLKIDAHRSSGAGGQHVNKTDSAIRITHLPTGIVVGCQTERSQVQNRETAMRMLKSKLLEIKEREKLERIEDITGAKLNIEWGSQIRSYVFMPYTLVKDNRTGWETGNIAAVMDGEIDDFINEYLKMISKKK